MTLKLTVDSIESIPEPLRDYYEERDGKFALKVDGVEDTSGLKSALDAERKIKRDLEKKVKRWESLGKTDEEIADLLKAQEEAEAKRAKEAGDTEAILKQHQDKWAKDRKALEDELNAARASERNAIIENSVMAALTKASATEEGIDLLPDRLASRIKFETEGGKRVIRIMQPDGETPMAGSGTDGLANFDDLVKEAMAKWPSLFKGTGAGGSGTPPKQSAGGTGGKKRSEMSAAEKAAFIGEHGQKSYLALPY
jgi:flagellar biosynthesis GTPase FlhF